MNNYITICSRCGCEVTFDSNFVTDGYYCACLDCDEDLFSFEVEKINEVK